MKDTLGDHLKQLEWASMGPTIARDTWVIARLDGRSFSKRTKNLQKPFDARLHAAMLASARFVMEDMDALCAYQQSDEITLVWSPIQAPSERPFGGRRDKWLSILAASASVALLDALRHQGLDTMANGLPHMDARVVDKLSFDDAAAFVAWRAQDARRNGLTNAAYSLVGHKTLMGMDSQHKKALLDAHGTPFDTFPAPLRNGTLLTRVLEKRTLTEAERARIPAHKRPAPDATFLRTRIVEDSTTYLGNLLTCRTHLAALSDTTQRTPKLQNT
jgi:tRNA(His) 5'-end guanylyltransferase